MPLYLSLVAWINPTDGGATPWIRECRCESRIGERLEIRSRASSDPQIPSVDRPADWRRPSSSVVDGERIRSNRGERKLFRSRDED